MPSLFHFAGHELDLPRYELRRDGQAIKLERIPMDLLVFLVEHRGRLVTREEIIDRIWGKEVFLDTENGINTAVRKVRQVLKDDPAKPQFLETVPGKGYRFIAQVTVEDKEVSGLPANSDAGGPFQRRSESRLVSEADVEITAPSTETRPLGARWLIIATSVLTAVLLVGLGLAIRAGHLLPTSSPPKISSLAVLPLENLSGDPSQEYFADGMTDALITDLAQISSLRVISRTSAMRYKGARKPLPEIAHELGVDGIVEGTVMRSGKRVRITSQLIYAPADQHLWARSYERDVDDILTLQSDVALAIAGEVRTVLSPPQRTHLASLRRVDPEAYDLYLQGDYHLNQWTAAGVEKSLQYFQRAVEKDPSFAQAYLGLALAYNRAGFAGALPSKESFPKAKEAATQALVLDPLLAEAHAALAVVKARYEFDLPGAENEFLRAIELNPNSAIAHRSYSRAYLSSMKRHRDAIDEMKKAVELDPLSPETHYFLAGAYDSAGEFDRAVEEFRNVIEMDPNYGQNRLQFAHLLADLGRFEESIAEFEKGETLVGTNPDKAAQHATALRHAFQTRGAEGYWQESLSLGLHTMNESDQYWLNTPIHIAEAYARLGEKDKAFKWLERAYQDRDGIRLGFVNSNDGFNKLHGDPRYSDLLRRVGLPE